MGLTVAGVDYVDYEVAGAAGYAADEGTGYAEAERTEAEDAAVGYDDGFGGEAASGGSYEVQSGDTLTGIAGELGTSVDDLMAANGLTDPDMVYAGQTLAY
ncbi:MAG: LysM peptidoglycan-binding domain-containing protein [Rubrobacter sp.]|nr:LysM peptidoglycan-binding domain-containing protein [Rubrobacter sp.]